MRNSPAVTALVLTAWGALPPSKNMMFFRVLTSSDIPLSHCGGNPGGGLGTSVEKILAAIEEAWSDKGVAILVDLGGAETNSEMAIEMLEAGRQSKVVVCNAPIVEGAVMAATEAWGGASLEDVRRTAEELSPQ